MILDSEVLMMDANGHILPFGSLGIHKKNGYNGARPCLFVFDILEYNGKSMLVRVMLKNVCVFLLYIIVLIVERAASRTAGATVEACNGHPASHHAFRATRDAHDGRTAETF